MNEEVKAGDGFHPGLLPLAASLSLLWGPWKVVMVIQKCPLQFSSPTHGCCRGAGNINSTDWSERRHAGRTSQYHWPSKAVSPGEV